MQLKLTWRVKGRPDMDLLVSDDQTISETMQILEEKGLLSGKAAETTKYIKTLRADHQVNTLMTYREADILLNGILSDVSCVKLNCMIFAYHRRHPISMAWAAPA